MAAPESVNWQLVVSQLEMDVVRQYSKKTGENISAQKKKKHMDNLLMRS